MKRNEQKMSKNIVKKSRWWDTRGNHGIILYRGIPVKFTLRKYFNRSAPFVGRIASHKPAVLRHSSLCISLSAYANAITASLTNCSWSSNAVVFFCSFSLVVHIFVYFLLYGVSELFG